MKRINAISFIFLGLLTAGTISYAQTTYNFTKSGASGYQGPTQAQVNSAYSGTTLNNAVTINTRGVQEWTVPATGIYTIEAWGAAGTNSSDQPAGYGARMKGDFSLTQGTVLKIIVGQMPELTSYGSAGGGGALVLALWCWRLYWLWCCALRDSRCLDDCIWVIFFYFNF